MSMNTFDILPAQPEPTGRWIVDRSFLEAVRDDVDKRDEYVRLQEIEAVLIVAFDLLSVYFPNGLEARR